MTLSSSLPMCVHIHPQPGTRVRDYIVLKQTKHQSKSSGDGCVAWTLFVLFVQLGGFVCMFFETAFLALAVLKSTKIKGGHRYTQMFDWFCSMDPWLAWKPMCRQSQPETCLLLFSTTMPPGSALVLNCPSGIPVLVQVFNFMYMGILPKCVSVHHVCTYREARKKVPDPLELKLQTNVVAQNQTQVFWKRYS